MFSSCKETTIKSLADHLLIDGSWLEEGVDSPQAGLQAWIRVRVGMLGPLLGFDSFELSKWRRWAKIHGTHRNLNKQNKKWLMKNNDDNIMVTATMQRM